MPSSGKVSCFFMHQQHVEAPPPSMNF